MSPAMFSEFYVFYVKVIEGEMSEEMLVYFSNPQVMHYLRLSVLLPLIVRRLVYTH